MSLEQNSPRTSHKRPETWNPDNTLKAETVVPAPEHRDDKDKKKGSLKNKIVIALAGLGLAAGGGIAAKTLGGGDTAPAPERSPATSAPANPGSTTETPNSGETEAPAERPYEQLAVSAEIYKTPEEAIGPLVAIRGQMLTDAAKNYQEPEFGEEDNTLQPYFEAMYGADPAKYNPSIIESVVNLTEAFHGIEDLYAMTKNDTDTPPYENELSIGEIKDVTGNTVTYVTDYYSNILDTSLSSYGHEPSYAESHHVTRAQLDVVDGNWVIVGYLPVES